MVLHLLCFLSFGQRARLFSTDSELSNSQINDLYQDRKGIIWIATEDGINRYDGSKFTVYKEKPGGILNNYAKLIFEDNQNRLFFGYFNGLQIYDRAEDSFTTVPLLKETGEDCPAHIITMFERKDGTMLVGTSGFGIFEIKTNSDRIIGKRINNLVPSGFINHLFEDSAKNLWVATQDRGVFRIAPDGNLQNYFAPKTGVGSNVSSICEDQSGNVYIGSLGKGLFRYDQSSDMLMQVLHQGPPEIPIKVLYPIQNDQLLIGTDGEGMKLYDSNKNTVSNLNFNVSNFDFSKSKVHKIIEDNAGNYWLGLFQKGVAVIPSRIHNFEYIGYQSVINNTIGSNCIMALIKDHEGTFWVGADSDGLYGLGPNGKEIAHYFSFGHKTKVSPPATIMCMFEDSNNDFWVGSYVKGLSKLNRKTGKFEYITHIIDHQSNPINKIYSIIEDKQKNLWIATMGFGLYSMNLNTGEIKTYYGYDNPIGQTGSVNSLHNKWVSCLLLSQDDNLYVGTTDGVSCLDMTTKAFTSLSTKYPALKGQIVHTLHLDQAGGIWIGTSHGLMLLTPMKDQLRIFTTENGLPSNVISAIESDTEQNLWISTNYGISKFNPADSTFINYYYHDGLQGNEFSKRASFKDIDGTIYFGGINGITYFDPQKINDWGRTLEIKITGFYIQDTPVKKGMYSGNYEIVNKAVMDADTFHLSYEDNSFSIEFSAMEFINPKRINYLYSMKGDEWINLQQGTNTVTFNNLKPGTYKFRVKAKDFATYSDTQILTVIIHPAWYLSTWARLGYFVLSILILFGISYLLFQRYKTRKKMREHLHAEQINEAKLEFFTNISHEIRTPLSLIINPLKKLIDNDFDSGRQRVYSVMRRNTEKILHLVNQLMDLRKIDKGKIYLKFRETAIADFIKETCEIFEEQIQAKSIHFQIKAEADIPNVWIDQNYFDKTILNVVSNAIKFSPEGGKIDLIIGTVQSVAESGSIVRHLYIKVLDNGTGISEADMERVFDRFYQSPENKDQSASGTGIGLHLTRSIVELHHGTIMVRNRQDQPGSEFTIQIPIGASHLSPTEMEKENCTNHHTHDLNMAHTIETIENENEHIKAKTRKRILVVDDDAEIRRYICNELAGEYHTAECSNGKEALSLVLKEKPDLIISDIMMPEMDGITLCKKIKQNVNINHIPIILLTARSGEKENVEGLDIGADGYIPKPFNMEILRKTTENIIKNRDLLKNNFSGSQSQNDKIKNIDVQSANEKLMQKLMNVINLNINNPDLNVEMIAMEIGISRVHLYRKLKEITNQSVRDLIRNVRLRQAAELLTNKSINVSEVAYATGFPNPSKFSSSFKEFYGVSPKDYIENSKKA